MSTSQLLDQVLALPADERARFARQILLSLDDEPADEDHEQAWEAEIVERARRLAAGETQGVDWRPAHQAMREKLRENKP